MADLVFSLCISLLSVMYLLDIAYRKFYLARCLTWFHLCCPVWLHININFQFSSISNLGYTGGQHCRIY